MWPAPMQPILRLVSSFRAGQIAAVQGEANALRTASQAARSEDECLRAFDMAREAILDAATHTYGRGGKDRHTLTARDIRR